MTKLYAIVRPVFTMGSDGFADLPYLLVSPLHRVMFEQVCGYSLGQEVVFFDSLDNAKMELETGIKDSKAASKIAVQKAIIELDTNDQGIITEFSKIHTAGVERQYVEKQTEQAQSACFFKSVRVPVWKEQAINPAKDVSKGALEEMNIHYAESKNALGEQVQPQASL